MQCLCCSHGCLFCTRVISTTFASRIDLHNASHTPRHVAQWRRGETGALWGQWCAIGRDADSNKSLFSSKDGCAGTESQLTVLMFTLGGDLVAMTKAHEARRIDNDVLPPTSNSTAVTSFGRHIAPPRPHNQVLPVRNMYLRAVSTKRAGRALRQVTCPVSHSRLARAPESGYWTPKRRRWTIDSDPTIQLHLSYTLHVAAQQTPTPVSV